MVLQQPLSCSCPSCWDGNVLLGPLQMQTLRLLHHPHHRPVFTGRNNPEMPFPSAQVSVMCGSPDPAVEGVRMDGPCGSVPRDRYPLARHVLLLRDGFGCRSLEGSPSRGLGCRCWTCGAPLCSTSGCLPLSLRNPLMSWPRSGLLRGVHG